MKALARTLAAVLVTIALPAGAHHSFAIYDMSQSVEFEGAVFVEGAPANMLVRMGLNPADIAPGKTIKAIGAPWRGDPNAFLGRSDRPMVNLSGTG